MTKELRFKGSIFVNEFKGKNAFVFDYETAPMNLQFHKLMMSSFKGFNFSAVEKQKLSRKHRHDIHNYLNLNIFNLAKDALKLVDKINNHSLAEFSIDASDYGAFVALAALYSGKINAQKKVQFILHKSPMALFPKSLLKKNPPKQHSVIYNFSEENWINHFETLYSNDAISVKFKKAA